MTDLRKAAEMELDALEDVARKTPTTHVRAGKAMIGDKEHVALWFDDSSDPIQQADYINQTKPEKILALIEALRQALAMEKFSEVNQEPVAKYTGKYYRCPIVNLYQDIPLGTLLYTAPPKREWVGLTDEEFEQAVDGLEDLRDCWIQIEAKLKERNT